MNSILTEFQKLKRYGIILVGIIGVTCSPVISIAMQNIMSDDAKNVLNYTFPDLLDSTIWNNMTIFFPMILALIGGYMINREYTDDTLKNILTVPISFQKLIVSKLAALSMIALFLGFYNALVTIITGLICRLENMSLAVILPGSAQIIGMALFTCIAEFPLIAFCGCRRDAFKGGAVAAFLLGYFTIYFKNPLIRNLYPFSAGLSIVQFGGEGFVSDTSGSYSTTQNAFIGICVILAMMLLTGILINISGKENGEAAPSKKGGRNKKEKKEII